MDKPGKKYIKELSALRKKAYAPGELESLKDLLFRVRDNFSGRECIVEKVKKTTVSHSVNDFYNDVSALGTALINKGLQGAHIAILGENSYNWIVAFFAITASGSVAVPLDKELPADDICRLLKGSDADAVFCSAAYRKNVSHYCEKNPKFCCFSLESGETAEKSIFSLINMGRVLIAQGDTSFMRSEVHSDDTAVIIFTSGTTGANKGVMLTHKNLTVNAEGVIKHIHPVCSIMSVLPMNHIYELGCGIIPFIYSNTLIYINDRLRNFMPNLKEFQPEIMAVVPLFIDSIYNKIVSEAEKSGKLKAMKLLMKVSNALLHLHIDLRGVFFSEVKKSFGYTLPGLACGGAAASPERTKFLCDLGFHIYIGYGLTETAPIASLNKNAWKNSASVGLPLEHSETKIYNPDADGNGEIWVRGQNVCVGYYKDDYANEVSFEDGWFKTGDYGRIGKKGELYITGRKKNLIILDNGKNIYPEEIETFFTENSRVINEAVVFEADNPDDGTDKKVLVMAVSFDKNSFQNETAQTVSAEISALNKMLPAYKRVHNPAVFDHEFPKTSTKKIIRNAVENEYNNYIGRKQDA